MGSTCFRATSILVVALASIARGDEPQPLSSDQLSRIRSRVDALMTKHRAPGATVSIGLEGRIFWSEGFGLADVENEVRATADTAYRTASIGKSMTATVAMKLVEEGKLDLEAAIQRYCPSFPEKPTKITVRDLVSMTSGIRHYGGPNEEAELFNTRHYDRVSDALDLFKNDPLAQPPGEDFLYTTWGYVALGCVLEGASKEEFRALVRRVVFDPAGMKDTRDDDPRAIVPHRARGYIVENGVLRNSRFVDMSSKMAAGGFVTTAPDLVRFLNAWMEERLVSKKSMDLMLTPGRVRTGTVDQFGMGWFLDDFHGMKAGLFGGGTPQVSGIVFFVPEKRLAVAAVFNVEGIPGDERIAFAEALADVVLGFQVPNPDHWAPAASPR